MSVNWAVFAGFVFACAGTILIAVKASRRIGAGHGYFHSGSRQQHQISLAVYNVTLGAGLTFQMSVGQQFGWLGLLQVVCVLVGYLLLARFVLLFVPSQWVERKNVFAAADFEIAKATGARSWFGPTISAWLLVFFILVLAFEAYVAGNILAPLLIPGSPKLFAVCISFALLCVAMITAVVGGWQAVLNTDKVQIVAVLVVILVFLGTALRGGDGAEVSRSHPSLDLHGWTTLLLLSVFAVATQFYSPVNWGVVSHLRKEENSAFLVGGALASLLLGLITLGGVFVAVAPGSTPLETLLDRLHASWASPDLWGNIAGFVVVIGGVSMVLSTSDSLILKLVMLAYDNILGRDSKVAGSDPAELKRIRACVLGAFLLAFLPLAALWITQPQIIFTLVAIVTGLNVLAPLAVAVPILHRLGVLHLLRAWVFLVASVLVLVSGTLGLYFALQGMDNIVTWVSFGSLVLSLVLCSGLVMWGKADGGRTHSARMQ